MISVMAGNYWVLKLTVERLGYVACDFYWSTASILSRCRTLYHRYNIISLLQLKWGHRDDVSCLN